MQLTVSLLIPKLIKLLRLNPSCVNNGCKPNRRFCTKDKISTVFPGLWKCIRSCLTLELVTSVQQCLLSSRWSLLPSSLWLNMRGVPGHWEECNHFGAAQFHKIFFPHWPCSVRRKGCWLRMSLISVIKCWTNIPTIKTVKLKLHKNTIVNKILS